MWSVILYSLCLQLIVGQSYQGMGQYAEDAIANISDNEHNSMIAIQSELSNSQTFTFKGEAVNEFIISSLHQQQVKLTAQVYWKKDDVYGLPSVKQGQIVKFLVIQNNNAVKVDKEFYTTIGLKFDVKRQFIYTLRFYCLGQISKLITFTFSKLTPNVTQGPFDVRSGSYQINKIATQMKYHFKTTQINQILKYQISKRIQQSSNMYYNYQIAQVLLLIGMMILQIIFVKRLFKISSIV